MSRTRYPSRVRLDSFVFRALVCIVLSTGLGLWATSTLYAQASSANIVVNDAADTGVAGCESADAPFDASTIQAGITAASAGETIFVCPGTYEENVTVGKSVTLQGNNYNVAGNGARAQETQLDAGGSFGVGFSVQAADVTIEGFELIGDQGVVLDDSGNNGWVGLTVQNNLVGTNISGVRVENLTTSSTQAFSIQDNQFALQQQEFEDPSPSSTAGVGNDLGEQTASILVAAIDGTAQPTLSDNVITDNGAQAQDGVNDPNPSGRNDGSLYGYVLRDVEVSGGPVTIDHGGLSGPSITGTMQGIAILDGQTGAPSNFEIQNVELGAFAGVANDDRVNFHAGIFVFTADGSSAYTTTGSINSVIVDGTDVPDTADDPGGFQPSAGIYFGGFSAEFGSGSTGSQSVTVTNATVTNNANRGIFARGDNVTATVTQSTITGNGNAPASGNPGTSVIGRQGASLTVTESIIEAGSSATSVIQADNFESQFGNDPGALSVTVSGSLVDRNGSAAFLSASVNGSVGANTLEAAENAFADAGTLVTSGSTIFSNSSINAGSVDINPFLNSQSDTDGVTSGFQVDFSTVRVTPEGDQVGAFSDVQRIAEGIDVVNAGGTVILDVGTFTENVTVDKQVVLQGSMSGTSTVDATGGTGEGVVVTVAGVTVDNVTVDAERRGIAVRNVTTTSTDGITLTNNTLKATLGQEYDGADAGTDEGDDPAGEQAVGIELTSISGPQAPVIQDNVIGTAGSTADAPFYGYAIFDVQADTPTLIQQTTTGNTTVNGVQQGVAVFNTDGATAAQSSFGVEGVEMDNFTGSSPNDAVNFHAGVYVFTSPDALVEGTISSVTVRNTGIADGVSAPPSGCSASTPGGCGGQASSGLYFGDFGSTSTLRQSIAIDQVTLENNNNRGLFLRGPGAAATVTASSLTGNGNAPFGYGGNAGFSIIVRNNGSLTVNNTFVTGPASVSNPDGGPGDNDLIQASAGGNSSVLASQLDRNGIGEFTAGSVNASGNVWVDGGIVDPPAVAGISTGTDYTPWLPSSTDTSTDPGFQGDTSLLNVDVASPQLGTSGGRIEEAVGLGGSNTIRLLSTGGTTNTYAVPSPVVLSNNLEVAQNLSFASSASSITVPGELIVDPAVTSLTNSPTFVVQDVTEGTSGFGSAGSPGADAGWRMYAVPCSNGDGSVLGDDLDFSTQVSSILYTYDESTQDYVAGDGTTGTSLPSGRGFFLYLFDDDVDPIQPSTPLTLDASGPLDVSTAFPTGGAFGVADLDVSLANVSGVPAATDGSKVHLLGNPFAQSFDVSSLTDGGTTFGATGEFVASVQVWNYNTNGYDVINSDPAGSGDVIAPWQGFWLERDPSTSTGGSVTLTFERAGLTRGATFVPAKAAPVSRSGSMDLVLSMEDADGTTLSRDRSSLYFRDGVSAGTDAYDATKYAPFTSSTAYVQIALQDADLSNRTLVQSSLPYDFSSRIRIPLHVTARNLSGTGVLSVQDREDVPDAWTVFLTDTQTGESIALDPGAEYRFDLSATSEPSTRFDVTVSPNGTLPVELASFGGTAEEQRVVLDWTTATETNNAGFRVQQKTTSGYQTLGFVEGSVTTSEPQRYSFVVQDLDYGTHTFRLVQVDLDGTATPHAPADIQVQMTRPFDVSGVAPNPVRQSGEFTVAVRARQPVQIHVYDVLGRRVSTLHDGDLAPETDHRFRFDAAGMASGLYFVRVTGETFTDTRRVVVVR